LLIRTFSVVNWVNPMHPANKRYPDRKERGWCRGQKMPEKAKAAL
jgi:hypothetical protein